jgi:hypothetical protein
MDINIGTIRPAVSINSTALEVPCPPPGIERKFEKVLFAANARVELKSSANES